MGKSVLLNNVVKISKLISIQAEFISNTLSGKRMGLAEVGEMDTGTQSLCPKDLHSLRGKVRELHIEWWVKA